MKTMVYVQISVFPRDMFNQIMYEHPLKSFWYVLVCLNTFLVDKPTLPPVLEEDHYYVDIAILRSEFMFNIR